MTCLWSEVPTFSEKGRMVKVLDFVGHEVSVAFVQLFLCSFAIDNAEMMGVARFGPWTVVCQVPWSRLKRFTKCPAQ